MNKESTEKIKETAEMLSSVFQAISQGLEVYDTIKKRIPSPQKSKPPLARQGGS
jgi:hypothetical protein